MFLAHIDHDSGGITLTLCVVAFFLGLCLNPKAREKILCLIRK